MREKRYALIRIMCWTLMDGVQKKNVIAYKFNFLQIFFFSTNSFANVANGWVNAVFCIKFCSAGHAANFAVVHLQFNIRLLVVWKYYKLSISQKLYSIWSCIFICELVLIGCNKRCVYILHFVHIYMNWIWIRE